MHHVPGDYTELSSRKRKILTLEFSVGVITDVHSVPVPIETQDVRTNPLSAHQVCGCGCVWQLHVIPPMRDRLCFTTIFTGLRGGCKWEGLL